MIQIINGNVISGSVDSANHVSYDGTSSATTIKVSSAITMSAV